ncbi:MFS transporter [Streptomyces mirabilis]|uniref:MFS transporter n=1 Tax=Streptomyces mirabilis TaxID=68239 RepID=UPI00368F216D
MGILQLFSADLHLGLSSATNAIAAYAAGVVIGAPTITLAAARMNRRRLLLGLMGLFVVGNLLSSLAMNLGMLAAARFVSGLPRGAYFGAGVVVASYVVGPGRSGKAFSLVMTGLTVATIVGSPLATFLGQTTGWRVTYVIVAGVGAAALLALLLFVPRTRDLSSSSLAKEVGALRKPAVWTIMGVAALGVASIFAVYSFIGPYVTDAAGLDLGVVPIALALFGIGMTAGNLYGGRIADRHPSLGLVGGFGTALVVLALYGAQPWVLFVTLVGIGAAMMTAIPTIQVRLTDLAPESPTLMGAMNLASLNVANAIGTWAGGAVIGAGFGTLSSAWAGFFLTLAGLLLFSTTHVTRVAEQPLTPQPGSIG